MQGAKTFGFTRLLKISIYFENQTFCLNISEDILHVVQQLFLTAKISPVSLNESSPVMYLEFCGFFGCYYKYYI